MTTTGPHPAPDRASGVEAAIEGLDRTRLFAGVDTQSTDGDRCAWLAIQRAVRKADGGYLYLEIGSHLGGSIQQHVVDPRCRRIFSIDKRPLEQRDDREGGTSFRYEGNSTERMLENLARIDGADLSKLVCFDADAREVDRGRIDEAPGFCFIDGEHTREAALSDFEFCLEVCAPDAALVFHDDWIVVAAIRDAQRLLRSRGIPFRALKVRGGSSYVIGLRDCPALRDPALQEIGEDGDGFVRRQRLRGWLEGLAPGLTRRLLALRTSLRERRA